MGLFDIFTGAPAKKAAQQQRSYLDQTQQTGNAGIESALGQSLGFVNQGANTAAPFLQAGYGNAGDILAGGTQGALNYVGAGAGGALGALGQGAGQAIRYLNQGQAGAVGQYGQARADLMGGSAAYDPLASLAGQYGQGRALYQDALGINGAQGNARATGAFQAGPGYQFQVDQGLDAINRRRNAGGMLASGNADRDAQTFGQGLANQTYNSWLGNLQGFVSPELQAATSVAGGRANMAGNLANTDVGLAGLLSSGGQQRAGIATGLGAAQAGVATGAGNTLADVLRGGSAAMAGNAVNQGTSLANLYNQLGLTQAGLTQGAEGQKLNLTNSVLQPYNQTYGQEAAAQMQGSGNLWNLGLNLAKLGTGFLPSSIYTQPKAS